MVSGSKKRKNAPSLQEALDRRICYYCERDFEDDHYLIDHMKAKHYKCERCGRRLTTAGGLSVHMSQVHKEKLEKVANAMPEREKPDIEIFGMVGFPEKALAAIHTRVTNEWFKQEHQLRKETGNPPKGGPPAPSNPQKNESKEEMLARLAEHKAKKLAAREAAAGGADDSGSGTNTPLAKKWNVLTSEKSQDSPHANLSESDTVSDGASRRFLPVEDAFPAMQGSGVDAVASNPAVPYGQDPTTLANSMYPTSSMSRGPLYATSYLPMNPAAAGTIPSKPSIAGSGSPPSTSFSHGSPPQSTVPSATPRQNSLPSVPGLPQRPAFETPSISKEDMARMHGGVSPAPPGVPAPYHGQTPMDFYTVPNHPPPPPVGPPRPQYDIPSAQQPGFPPNGSYAPPYAMSNSPNGVPPGSFYPPHPGGIQPPPIVKREPDEVDDLIQKVTGASAPKQNPAQTMQEGAYLHNSPGNVPPGSLAQPTPPPTHPSKPTDLDSARTDFLAAVYNRFVNAQATDTPEKPPAEETIGGQTHLSSEPSGLPKAAKGSSKTSKTSSSKHAKDSNAKMKLVYSDTTLSPEEKRARRISSRWSKRTETVIDQTGEDGQEVTGPVDESLEP